MFKVFKFGFWAIFFLSWLHSQSKIENVVMKERKWSRKQNLNTLKTPPKLHIFKNCSEKYTENSFILAELCHEQNSTVGD